MNKLIITMIYYLTLYELLTGKVLLEISFEKDEEFVDRFGSFFSALNQFVTTLIFKTSKKINLIELDNFVLRFTPILFKTEFDLITVFDKSDTHIIEDIIRNIKEIIYDFSNLFIHWKGYEISIFLPMGEKIKSSVRNWMIKNNLKIPTNLLSI